MCREMFQGGGTSGTSLWIRNVCDGHPHGQGPGGVSAQVDQAYYRETDPAASGQKLVITPLDEATEEAELEGVDVNFLRRQNTFAQYIMTRPILDLCEELVQRKGTWAAKMQLEQEGLDLGVKLVMAVEEAGADDKQGTEEAEREAEEVSGS